MKIFVTGTRGIPDMPGGVESHCQQLYPLIVKQGHEVKSSRRKPYVSSDAAIANLTEWSGIQLVDNFTPRKKSIEAIVHTFIAILEAKKMGCGYYSHSRLCRSPKSTYFCSYKTTSNERLGA